MSFEEEGKGCFLYYKSVQSPFHTRKVSKCFTQTRVLGLLPCFKDFYFTFILTLTGVTAIQFWHRRSGVSTDPTVKVTILHRLPPLQTPATSSGGVPRHPHLWPTGNKIGSSHGPIRFDNSLEQCTELRKVLYNYYLKGYNSGPFKWRDCGEVWERFQVLSSWNQGTLPSWQISVFINQEAPLRFSVHSFYCGFIK